MFMRVPQSTVRYTGQIVARAREHRQAEWSLREIKRLLQQEFGVDPSVNTVHGWVVPLMAERARSRHRNTERRRHVRDEPHTPRRVTPERALERMSLLRGHGMPFKWIAVAALVWWGEDTTGDSVRYRLEGK